jgi:putative phosphonate metabolism protein
MRYAIYFTPSIYDPLSVAAASWLGRNVYSGEAPEAPPVAGFSRQELAFHTAVPRRYGFHGTIKAPFRLHTETSEAALLKSLLHFASTVTPFEIPRMEIARLGEFYGLAPSVPCDEMCHLAASVVQAFDTFRAPLSDVEIERRDPDRLTAPQFSNLHRWGYPYVMDEYRFHMMLTGPVHPNLNTRFETALRQFFGPLLNEPLKISSLGLFIEPEAGAPLRVHSQHPLGKLSEHRPVAASARVSTTTISDLPAGAFGTKAALVARRLQANC